MAAPIKGTKLNDLNINGTNGADKLQGKDGNDFLSGGQGNDDIDGGRHRYRSLHRTIPTIRSCLGNRQQQDHGCDSA